MPIHAVRPAVGTVTAKSLHLKTPKAATQSEEKVKMHRTAYKSLRSLGAMWLLNDFFK